MTTISNTSDISDEELLRGWKSRLGQLSVAEKVEQANLLKRQGNLYVKKGEPKRALASYAKVFAYVNGLSVAGDAMSQYAQGAVGVTATKAEGDQIQDIKIAVWANMALCHLKLGEQPERALSCCDKVLELEPQHSKARFRKAQAMIQLTHYEIAYKLLGELLEEEPKNASVRSEIRALLVKKRAYDAEAKEKEKKAFGNMFK
ncbi:FKBP-type peptidyl-prolyl cis-trans isomerase [Plasmopara halstedii]|uniref:FKBP-type peptidyl-prolyl cis-trans isomerase n=1 Tax=Plasmopara halstedii TaxID=4781 RepID=A0A0P1A9F0_PLAHL|nr:FKBP-type peptidyl-prolyl cis-trans isomerase [Plasmopara halstedii]CEG36879.1 FKBP-type peptidyl-prolyl cis-trans isomerase [Plasmopara halstedii]|eukprot:XP_024573248.1 FKBP-type peptidyl-prolyl cis-trans isomerase [Plasmopara halstedii]